MASGSKARRFGDDSCAAAPERRRESILLDDEAWSTRPRGAGSGSAAPASARATIAPTRPEVSRGHDRDESRARTADRRGREALRPPLVVGAERAQPDPGRGRRGPLLLGLR